MTPILASNRSAAARRAGEWRPHPRRHPRCHPHAAAAARDRVAKRLTPERIAEARRLARDWRPK